MRDFRRDEWEDDSEVYSDGQVEAVLQFCGIDIESDTNTVFLAFCPFHGNADTPAFAVNKENGLYLCFNPSCQASGSLEWLVRTLKGLNPFEAMRVIAKHKNAGGSTFAERVEANLKREPEFTAYPQEVLDRLYAEFPGSRGHDYMRSRHFADDTLDYFRVGYSTKKNMVSVPMHDPTGMPVGLIGRSASDTDKVFKNTVNLPKSLTTWNFHRAKVTGETVIVCEASYDAMRIHQAGYPNVVALLGGYFTQHHAYQLGRTFTRLVIMTDYDKLKYYPNCRKCGYKVCQGHNPGRDLGRQIVEKMPATRMLWAIYDHDTVYPHDAKDAGDMTDDEIRQCLRGAVTNLEYEQLGIEDRRTVATST